MKEGESVTLYCSSMAHPNASYMWFKNNILSQSTEEYTLNDVKPEDSGEYQCQASNYHGQEDSTVMINVKCKFENNNKPMSHLSVSKFHYFNNTLKSYICRFK